MIDALRAAGVERGSLLALAVAPGVGLGLASMDGSLIASAADDPCAVVAAIDAELHPRWVVWSIASAVTLVAADVRVSTSWDIAAVHRLLFGGWRADPERVWALMHQLGLDALPNETPADLFHLDARADGDPEEPVRSDGYLRPDWVSGGWSASPDRLARWAGLAALVAARQREALAALPEAPYASVTARAESSIELLCAELATDGLPMRRDVAEAIIANIIGQRPSDDREADEQRRGRDAEVIRHVSNADDLDLRSPGQVKSLLRRAGLEVPDTRAWRLRSLRDAHPVVDALLAWRKAERVATTYGYGWLDDDMYAPVARQLAVERSIAKVAVLGAMYGQTTGHGAQALRRLESSYPVAMAYLRNADRAGQGSRSLRTTGGRLIDVGSTNANDVTEREARRIAAARGRYGRNAMVQGAAAELFKMWALIVRTRAAPLNGRIVLCLHDELLVHVPAAQGETAARLVIDALDEAARRWSPGGVVRFVADVSVIERWSDAKS